MELFSRNHHRILLLYSDFQLESFSTFLIFRHPYLAVLANWWHPKAAKKNRTGLKRAQFYKKKYLVK